MKWASAISESSSLDKAVKECAKQVKSELGTKSVDVALAFVSNQHFEAYDDVPGLISKHLGAREIVGCSGGGVIGAGKEVENSPAFALTSGVLPDVQLTPFHISDEDLPTLDDPPASWEDLVGVTASDKPHFVILPDPFTIHADNLLLGLDYAFSGSVKIGGLASGGRRPGGNALFMGQEVFRSGVVGISLHGNVKVETIVAQGCRPIGQPMVVDRCESNVLFELDGKKPLEALQAIFSEANEEDRRLINSALHVGVVMDPLQEEFQRGDFLIRNVMGLHQETGALVVGEMLREGQVVQFHVRDGRTAADDLEAMMERYVSENGSSPIAGALLFQCLGRGEHLFGRPNHDSDLFQEKVSNVALTGFFCNGEIGPVGGTTFLHGFTSSFAMFTAAD